MAKLHKVELYIIDVNDNYSNLKEIMHDIGNSTDCSLIPFNSQEVEIDWHDGIDINFSNCPVENFREYFEENENENKNILEEEKCTYKEELITNIPCELMKNYMCFIGEWDDFYLGEDNYWHFDGEWCCEYFNPEADCCRTRKE